jgi:hypothetical protein
MKVDGIIEKIHELPDEKPLFLANLPISDMPFFTDDLKSLASAYEAAVKDRDRYKVAMEKVVEMNLQHAQDQYGDRAKAESWACVTVLREALKEDK